MAHVEERGHTEIAPRQYVQIAVVLGVLIAVELGLYYGTQVGLRRGIAIGGILLAAGVKAVLATAWFMHLRGDHRFYRQVFIGGAILALLVFAAALAILLLGHPS
jgi:caa(3)-type oxidase subunit IV